MVVRLVLVLGGLGACTSQPTTDTSWADPVQPDTLDLELSDAPIDVPAGTRFAADVPYDDYERTVLDVLLPESSSPTGLLMFVHGGGFTGGQKGSLYEQRADEAAEALERGYAVATVEYRLITDPTARGVATSLNDSRRALQFLRHHAGAFNIDPSRIAGFGTSAGAGTVLWLGSRDDMADVNASDPVERQSSRLSAVGLVGTQATYDIVDWQVVFRSFDLRYEDVAGSLDETLLAFYDMDDVRDVYTPQIEAYRAEVDMIEWMDAGDAPVWVDNPNPSTTAPRDVGALYHHGLHAARIMERANEVDLEEVTYIQALQVQDSSGEDMLDFLFRHLES